MTVVAVVEIFFGGHVAEGPCRWGHRHIWDVADSQWSCSGTAAGCCGRRYGPLLARICSSSGGGSLDAPTVSETVSAASPVEPAVRVRGIAAIVLRMLQNVTISKQ